MTGLSLMIYLPIIQLSGDISKGLLEDVVELRGSNQ